MRSIVRREPGEGFRSHGVNRGQPIEGFVVLERRDYRVLRPCQKRPLHLVSAPSSPQVAGPHKGAPRAARKDAVVAQLVRAPVCGTGGRWFEPTQLYQPSSIWRIARKFGTFGSPEPLALREGKSLRRKCYASLPPARINGAESQLEIVFGRGGALLTAG